MEWSYPQFPICPRSADCPLCKFLQDVLDCPMVLENNPNCFAPGESVLGQGKPCEIAVEIILATGLCVGTVMGAKLCHRSHSTPGDMRLVCGGRTHFEGLLLQTLSM
ncbi:MAG: hypothetical protein DRQ02_10475 [Candidatus Latescibacterota bacterium]|nr:MAG: hypothetical protein DRQ02_10475 [Candidatus Latescibacterota bacterium]HDN67730.1 ROK family protein [Bacillota bacterium]